MLGLYKYFSLVGLERPTFESRCMLDPFSAIALGVGAVTGIGSLISGNHANSENRKLTREQMAWQSSEAQAQRSWQHSMWERQNQWNTPLNQKRLYEAAGFNPALAYGAPATAGSVGSGASAGSASPIPQQPLDFEPLSRVANVAAQTDLMRSQARNAEADTLGKVQSLQKTLDNLDAQREKLQAERDYLQKQGKNIDEVTRGLEMNNDLTASVKEELAKSFTLSNKETQARIDDINDQIASRGFNDWLASRQFGENQRLNTAQIQSWKDAASVAYGQLDALRQELKIKQGHLDVEQKESVVRRVRGIIESMSEDLKRRGLKINVEQQEKYLKSINSSNVTRFIYNSSYAFGDFMQNAIPVMKIFK